MAKIKETIIQLTQKTIEKSLLIDIPKQECNDFQKSILENQAKLWLQDNKSDPDDKNKDYFYLSMGKLFEYYVVNLLDTKNWELVSWRSDKIQNLYKNNKGIKPETNHYPDIIIKYIGTKELRNGFKKGERIAIECKWTNHKQNNSLELCAKDKISKVSKDLFYPINAIKDGACCFYFAIGVGCNIINKTLKPEAVFLIPASRIKSDSENEISECKVKRKLCFKKTESLISKIMGGKNLEDIIYKLNNLKEALDEELDKFVPKGN
ncbi:MAG: hypothetical protein KBT27_02450 [Prevotellaceae bacterium]|nr:hypothetical protein [Candidatus Faecinaster equi]